MKGRAIESPPATGAHRGRPAPLEPGIVASPGLTASRRSGAAEIVEPAAIADGPAVAALLRADGLPHEDITPHLGHFLVARCDGEVVGAVGAEVYGEHALLRSFVVALQFRGAGLGSRLVEAIGRVAPGWGVKRWWLLTTTAERFFAARGFRPAERAEAPAAIRQTAQFQGGCSRSAVCLTREVAGINRAERADFDGAIADFSAKLRAFIRRRVRDDATADDLTQETLLKVYRSRASLRDGLRLEAWVYRVARTTLIDHYRRARPSEPLPAVLAGETEPPDEVTVAMTRSLRHFLEELPEAYREPVRLAEFEGLPLAKIALRFELSLTAVKSRVRRGRAMLKQKLQACCRLEFDRMGKIIGYERRQKTPCAC